MSSTVNVYGHAGKVIYGQSKIGVLPLDNKRGYYGIWLVIATETCLFLSLFSAYLLMGSSKFRWQTNRPPKLGYALVLLAILIGSSIVLIIGERMVKQRRYLAARVALVITILMGLVFLVLQAFEYIDHWKTLTPDTNAYGSIFYTITTFHAAHVIVGLLLLCYVLFLPQYEPASDSPHLPYKTVSLYWHFVDVVWIFVVAILYLIPHGIVHGF